LPMPEDPRAHVLAVKRGDVPQREVSRQILSLTTVTKQMLEDGTPLRPEPDWVRINAFSIEAHLSHWRSP